MLVDTGEGKVISDLIEEHLKFSLSIVKIYDRNKENTPKTDFVNLCNEVFRGNGFKEIGDALWIVNDSEAQKLGKFMIAHDLVYNKEYIKDEKAESFYNMFIQKLDKIGIFFTNVDTVDLSGSYGSNLFCDASFQVCLIFIGKNKCGIIYKKDED